MKTRKTTDASKILRDWYIKDDPAKIASIQKERINAEVASQIYKFRTKTGLSQKQLAELVGTTQSVISRLEDADYTGHSLDMLSRIAAALHFHLQVKLVPNKRIYALG
jgi:ribosome-binding protein aMBF1 (putative translation factor)